LRARRLEVIAGVESKYYTVLETAELLRNARKRKRWPLSQTNMKTRR
jgi:hypothetical protein